MVGNVKSGMGQYHDSWLEKDDNLNKGTEDFPMWDKGVLITKIAGDSWKHVCETFNFKALATCHIGHLMTADGMDDDKIKLQGIDNYTFTDADGGKEGDASEDDEEDADEDDDDVYLAATTNAAKDDNVNDRNSSYEGGGNELDSDVDEE